MRRYVSVSAAWCYSDLPEPRLLPLIELFAAMFAGQRVFADVFGAV